MEDNNKENGIKKSYIILLVITISFIVGLIVLVGTTDLYVCLIQLLYRLYI